MPIGSGVETVRLLPSVPYVIDPAAFAASTTENVNTVQQNLSPGPGNSVNYELPDADVVGSLKVIFQGTLTITTAAQTPGFTWPYGLLSGFTLTANGVSHDLWNVDGCDLDALGFVDNPHKVTNSDVFPGAVGGGTPIAVGAYPLFLSWNINLAVDENSLIAALFAQSTQTLLNGSISEQSIANLFPGGAGADIALTGSFSIVERSYEIPIDQNGRMVLPDVTKLHQVVAITTPWTNTGDNDVNLIRAAGQLMRVFVSGYSATNTPLSAAPSAAAANAIDKLALKYGVSAAPYLWNPASVLAQRNEDDYGALVPYDRVVIDQMTRNPMRDMILLQGVTNLRTTVTIDPAVAPTQGQATLRAVEEILI